MANKISSAWLTKLGEKVYIISHAKSCFYSESVDGEKITVYDKLSSLLKSTLSTALNVEWTITDCNTQLEQSVIYIPYTVKVTNLPDDAVNGWLQTIPSNGDCTKQIFHRAGTANITDNKVYIRTYHKQSNVWSDWSEIITSSSQLIKTYCLKHKSITCASTTATYPKAENSYDTAYIKCTTDSVGVELKKDGCYLLSARGGFKKVTNSKAGYRQVQVMLKGASETAWDSVVTARVSTSEKDGSVSCVNTSSVIRRLKAGDMVSVCAQQYSGSTASFYYSYLEIAYLGA